jgi:Holliday junction resolvasome RuvABC endonuclease subunit
MDNVKKIVAFDPGLNLGWCASDHKRVISSGCIKNDASRPMQERQNELTDFITHLILIENPDVVVVEAINRVAGSSTDLEKNGSTWALYWIYGEIIRLSGKRNIPVFPISPSSMKSAVTKGKREPDAKGLASKEEVMRVVKSLYGERKMRSDESDAIGLAICYWMIYDGEYTVTKSKPKKRKKNAKSKTD